MLPGGPESSTDHWMPNMSLVTEAAPHSKRPRDANANAPHLQRLIEKQPSCLMRVNMDGVLLAANDAALSLLGASDTIQVLGKPLTEWVVPEHQLMWSEFSAVVASDTARSLECDFTDMSSTRRTLLLHGVPVLDHPDGTPSIILGARDVSRLRQIEASQEAEKNKPRSFPEREQLEGLLRAGRKHLEDQRGQLVAATAERKRLESLLGEKEEALRQLQNQRDEFERQHVEHHERGAAKERDAGQQLDALRAELAQAANECQRLSAAMTEQEASYQQLIAEQDEQQRAQAERHQLELQQRERQAQQQLEAVQAQISTTAADRDRIQGLLKDQEAAYQRLIDDQADQERAQTERHQLDLQQRERQLHQRADALQAQTSEVAADRDRLQGLLKEQESAYQRLIDDQAEQERVLTEQHRLDVQTRARESEQQLDSLHRQVSDLATELSRLQGLLSASAERQRQMAQELADGSVELRFKDLATAQLTPFAAAGRLALELGEELQRVMKNIDRGTATMLAQCPLEAALRGELESIRGEAIKAASLAGQLEQARSGAQSAESGEPGMPGAEV